MKDKTLFVSRIQGDQSKVAKERWVDFWDRAKELEKIIPVRKRQAYSRLKTSFPEVKQNNFGNLARAGREGKLDEALAAAVAEEETTINQLIGEAKYCRQESERLLREVQKAERRPMLDPSIDPIPPGPYPKLRECKAYPLRRDCNYGENETSRWNRCEYMKYDQSKACFDPRRWICAAPE